MNDEKNIAIIGANEFQLPLILKAKNLGYTTHVFAWKCGDEGEQEADVFYPISVTEKEKILEVCESLSLCGVCTIGSDLANLTVNYVRRGLGMPANTLRSDIMSTNKFAMRESLERCGVPVPKHFIVNVSSLEDSIGDVAFSFPLIVKPVDRSGSRAIAKVHDYASLREAVSRACEESFEGNAIVEEFIEGDEYSCEAITYQSDHKVLAVTRKHTSGSPRYIETGHDQPSGLSPEVLSEVEKTVIRCLSALEIEYGASHSEFFVTPDKKIRIVEIGARMGGDYIGSDLVELSTGFDFLKMVIDVACGKPPCLTRSPHYASASVRFAFSDDDFEVIADELSGKANAKLIRNKEKSHAPEHVVLSSSDRIGYSIYAFGEEPIL